VNIRFGSGDDTFTLAATPFAQTITGSADGGGGTNTFNQDPSWTLVNFTLTNF
jgi:hypothetical protein